MKKWRCTVCGEIVESDVRPDQCPLCKVPKDNMILQGAEEDAAEASDEEEDVFEDSEENVEDSEADEDKGEE